MPEAAAAVEQSNHPTDRHLRSILSNPLFATAPVQSQLRMPRLAGTAVPSDIFDSAVSRGLMTARRATGYLVAVMRQLQSEMAPADLRKRMAESGAGLRVLKWLQASRGGYNIQLLSYDAFVHHLIPFLVAEGLGETAWNWLYQLGGRVCASQTDTEAEQALSNVLNAILKTPKLADPEFSLSLDNRYSYLIRANRSLPVNNQAVSHHLRTAWTKLAWFTTVDASIRPKPSALLYEMFIDIGRPWDLRRDIAHLELHHPVNPDHTQAVEFLRQLLPFEIAEADTDRPEHKNVAKRLNSLASDTVSRLEHVGLDGEASWVKEFMSRSFLTWNIHKQVDSLDERTGLAI